MRSEGAMDAMGFASETHAGPVFDPDSLLRDDRVAWERVAQFAAGLSWRESARRSLTPSEADEIRGNLVVALLRDDRAVLRRIRDRRRLAAYLRTTTRRAGARIVARHRSRRPLLEAQLATESKPAPLDALGARGATGAAGPRFDVDIARAAIARLCKALTPLQTEVLWRRYVAGWSWNVIARSLGRGRTAILRLHERAIGAARRAARGGSGVKARLPLVA